MHLLLPPPLLEQDEVHFSSPHPPKVTLPEETILRKVKVLFVREVFGNRENET